MGGGGEREKGVLTIGRYFFEGHLQNYFFLGGGGGGCVL